MCIVILIVVFDDCVGWGKVFLCIGLMVDVIFFYVMDDLKVLIEDLMKEGLIVCIFVDEV